MQRSTVQYTMVHSGRNAERSEQSHGRQRLQEQPPIHLIAPQVRLLVVGSRSAVRPDDRSHIRIGSLGFQVSGSEGPGIGREWRGNNFPFSTVDTVSKKRYFPRNDPKALLNNAVAAYHRSLRWFGRCTTSRRRSKLRGNRVREHNNLHARTTANFVTKDGGYAVPCRIFQFSGRRWKAIFR